LFKLFIINSLQKNKTKKRRRESNLFDVFLSLNACKDANIDVSLPEQAINTGKKQAFNPQVDPNDDINARLRDFNNKLSAFQKDISVRDGQTMSVADVEWNVEAYLNSTYARADKPFIDQSANRDSFIVATTNGEISGANVLAAVASAKAMLITQYRSVRETSKHLVFVDIATKTVGSNQLQLTVSSFVGLNPLQSRDNPYTSTDNWIWANKLGKCDGTQVGKDAAIRLSEELNARHLYDGPLLGNPPPGAANAIFFTDIQEVKTSALNWETPNDPDDNIRDFLLYFSSEWTNNGTNFSTCIGFQDMNWYYNNIYGIVSNLSPMGIRPVGKYFLHGKIGPDYIIRGSKSTLFHVAEVNFGIPHLAIGPSPEM
jgi:hypothetical protein